VTDDGIVAGIFRKLFKLVDALYCPVIINVATKSINRIRGINNYPSCAYTGHHLLQVSFVDIVLIEPDAHAQKYNKQGELPCLLL
jgi:hypothetical protein